MSAVPLVAEAFDWEHGVFMGATIASETTAAQEGAIGALRRDPFAMLPFCGYHMGDYFGHWLDLGAKADREALPRIYMVNWFRKGPDGRFVWPGFGENSRVLKWIFERASGNAEAVETPVGWVPRLDDLDLEGLDEDPSEFEQLVTIDREVWRQEADSIEQHLQLFGDKLPHDIADQLQQLRERLEA
jgi:phosphoenolpyruvate carboxykinase (GTP)